MYAWAPGGDPVILPDQAGFYVGAAAGVTKVVLQFHYNNPTGIAGLHDNSAVTMYLISTNLRPQPAGLMFLGPQFESINIPPGLATWHQFASCTVAFSDINVFAHMGHAHYLGRQIWTTHYAANGTLLGYVSNVPNYDFSQQKFVSDNLVIRSGEVLKTHCVYDSTGETGYTYGGESTSNEMCLDVILYYPNNDLLWCVNSVEAVGCDSCDYYSQPSCEKQLACNATVNCNDYIYDCNTCIQAPSCTYCDSPFVSFCEAGTTLCDLLPSSDSRSGTCPSTLQTPCTTTHFDCASCTADTANHCQWCAVTSKAGLCVSTQDGVLITKALCQEVTGNLRNSSQCT